MTTELAALVAEYRAARDARRAAGNKARATDGDDAYAALAKAIRAEQDAAVRVAHTLAEGMGG